MSKCSLSPEVIVIGAGLSGLVCATRLVAGGASVVVVEARDRVGGRLHTGTLAGSPIDLGGQWMSVGQPRLAALAGALGVASFSQRRDGVRILDLPDARKNPFVRFASAFAQWRLARTVQRVAQAPPPDADAIAIGDWLDEHAPRPNARALIAMHAELMLAADPDDVSLLYYLRTFAATGGFGPAGPDLPGGGREHRFVGGAHALAGRLAEPLAASIQLSAPVRSIRDDGGAVHVHTDAGDFTAGRCVLALAPSLARAIEVELPDAARRMIEAARLGAVVKCFAAYGAPFWRDAGFSGEVYRPHATVRATVALESSDTAILLGFIVGPTAATWRDRDPVDRRDEVLTTFAEQFGHLATTPLDYLEVDWSLDPWSGGCPASLPPGALAAGAAWRAPHGRLHVAGTESAEAWPGYMEGAIEAGERAAAEVLALRAEERRS